MERRSLVLILLSVVFSKASLLLSEEESCLKSVSLNVNQATVNFYYIEPQWVDDGIDHDRYNNRYGCALLSNTQRETISQQFDEQSPSTSSLLQLFTGSKISTPNDFNRTRSRIHRTDRIFQNHRVHGLETWLPVRMPSAFTYTGAIYTNDLYQGVLHTFLRHWDDWREFIDDVHFGIANFSNVLHLLHQIQGATDNHMSRNALRHFSYFHRGLSAPDFNHLQDNLHDMQMLIYRFVLQNVNDHTYMGRSINNRGQLQEFFRVTDWHGQQRVMVICLSDHLYPPDPNFGDSRNIRTITTIYFLYNANAVSRIVTYSTTTMNPHDELK